MGNKQSFNVKEEGNFNDDLFQSYVSSDDKFSDLSGKTVAITGTTTGSLGFYVAKVAVAKKAKCVLLLNRESSRSAQTEEDVKKDAPDGTTVKTVTIDLQDIASVEKAAAEVNEIAKKNGGLDVLCNNAGIMARKDERTKDGFDVQMQANQLSHFLLTKLCMESIEMAAESRGEARIVCHSSSARFGAAIQEKFFLKSEPGGLGGDRYPEVFTMMGAPGGWQRYHQSKLACGLFAMELHSKLKAKESKVKALSCDPGWAHSNLQQAAVDNGVMGNFSARLGKKIGAQSSADGSLPCAMACFSPAANSGDFYAPEKDFNGPPVKTVLEGIPSVPGKEKEICNTEQQKDVWTFCENGLDIKFDL
jgi:NAD(P)-dependent dehydrogenase (short-subunit alcohol dehydrogenase family)